MSGPIFGPMIGTRRMEAEWKIREGRGNLVCLTAGILAVLAALLWFVARRVPRFGWDGCAAVALGMAAVLAGCLAVVWLENLAKIREGERELRDLEAQEREEPRP